MQKLHIYFSLEQRRLKNILKKRLHIERGGGMRVSENDPIPLSECTAVMSWGGGGGYYAEYGYVCINNLK
jgi:hypothetical protein